jgi:peptide/nickel transport system substrate-binding protein
MRSRMAAHARPLLAALLLIAPALLGPGGAQAQGDLVLKVGTDQKLETLNPWQSITVADYEIFQVQYELLVGFDNALKPAPAFADKWSDSADQKTHNFHIREGMKWSDGQPATCEDARWTYQLVLDAAKTETGYLGSGYLDPYLTNAGLKDVSCTDEHNLVVHTSFPSTLLLQNYVPILPKHVWSKYTLEQIGNADAKGYFANEPAVVGDGPYVATEWVSGDHITMSRNPNYWGTFKEGAPDEILFQTFSGTDTMVQALRSGEIDYAHQVGPDNFDALKNEPNMRASEGFANGYTYLSFNTRATHKGYRGSTSALEDQKFRDALGYAIDKDALVDKVLKGHGVPGGTIVPPYHVKWHVEPDHPRTFSIDKANQMLDAANYTRGSDGKRRDHEGKVINLRLTWPDSEDHSADAQFIKGWFEQVGIGVDAAVTEEGKLIQELYGPEAGDHANWDFYMWGWVGDPDPISLIADFTSGHSGTTNQIAAGLNDCFYDDPRYDELFIQQQQAPDEATRHAAMAEMQNRFYDAACNIPLYYDSVLDVQRTDKLTGWVNQPPDTGTPIFGYGYSGYLAVQDATLVPTPGPTEAAASAAPGSAAPGATATPTPASSSGDSTPLLLGALIVVIAVVGGALVLRRRSRPEAE